MNCECVKKCYHSGRLWLVGECESFHECPGHFISKDGPVVKVPPLAIAFGEASVEMLMDTDWDKGALKEYAFRKHGVKISKRLGKTKFVAAFDAARKKVNTERNV